jgi:hypothetical protein
MATTVSTLALPRPLRPVRALLTRLRHLTRRDIQIALGVLWLIDGVLQAQPFMFTTDFATQVIAPAGQGQPGFVSGPVHWASTVIAAHPVAWNIPFAAIQLLLGAGLLVPRIARVALAASILWALGVWYLGEGLAGLASGHASLVTGDPGSAVLYAILAAAAWPRGDSSREAPASWLPLAWAVVWVAGAVYQAVPGQAGVKGAVLIPLLMAVEYLVGVGALVRATRVPAALLGLVLALAFWVLGQDFGMLFSGQATDPNSGPALALMAIALLAVGSGVRTQHPR